MPKNQKDAFDDHDGTSLSRIEEIEETNTLHEIKGRHRRSTKSKFCKLKMGIDVYVRLAQISGRQVTASDVRCVTGKPHAECIKTVFSSLSNEEISILIDETMIEDTVAIKEMGGELYEGVSEGLNILNEHYDLFIVSNCQTGYIENFLSQNKFENLFKDYLCWGDTNEPKPLNTAAVIKKITSRSQFL